MLNMSGSAAATSTGTGTMAQSPCELVSWMKTLYSIIAFKKVYVDFPIEIVIFLAFRYVLLVANIARPRIMLVTAAAGSPPSAAS